MKKIMAVAAIATLTSTAYADVTVYGKIRNYVESYDAGTAGAITRVTGDTSRLGFKGGEQLDNGVGVFFNIETGIDSDAPGATTLGNRESVVGISTSDASIAMGRSKHSIARTMDQFGDIDHALGNIADSVHDAQGARFNNGVFTTLKAAGLTASLEYGLSEAAATEDSVSYSLAGNFGGAAVKYARYDDNAGDVTDMVGASYTIGDATLKALWSDTVGADVATSAGVDYKVSDRVTVLGGYGQKGNADGYAGGLTYNFSKRTMAHVRYSNFTGATAADDVTRVAIGLEHNF